MIMWILRGCFGALIVGLSIYAGTYYASATASTWVGVLAVAVVLLIGVGVVGTDILVRRKEITTLSAIYFGLLLGLLLGALFNFALAPYLPEDADNKSHQLVVAVRILITVILCYVIVSTLLQTKDEFRFIIPYVEFSKQIKGNRPLALDTSVIIDGRIADICDTRIIDSKLIVPRFVLQEL